ncbi:sensor histidine kinase [Alteribacillus sp. HJP-4]|uniref:sensor histidine kinase n=1 Tax=Alteribacillus sp. HJP-4 TaxID=2775394 RepID=UPI0035CD39B6
MRSFWFWFILLLITFSFSLLHISEDVLSVPWRLILCALFFIFYFLIPLFSNHDFIQTVILYVACGLAAAALWPEYGVVLNPYPLLVFSILAGEAVFRLSLRKTAGAGVILLTGALLPTFFQYTALPPLFIILYSALLIAAFILFRTYFDSEEETAARSEALLSEYRSMKRRLVSEEELTRRDERIQVGRDIHDSVGHKLTALLMQLEVLRLKDQPAAAKDIDELKTLAQESLDDTRSAVKALKQKETGGVAAILRLIRKLESESFIRVNFSVKQGALSAPLSNDQSIAVYRAVQEALTNIMRHSRAKEANIVFEAPGRSIFRFEITNSLEEKVTLKEGFGLRSMRERIEQTGGELDIIHNSSQFIIRGKFIFGGKEG